MYELFLDADLGVDVVQVTGSLKLGVSQTPEGSKGFVIATLFDVPTWRLWAEIDTEPQWYSWDESRTKLKSPGDGASILDRKIGAEAQEDTEGGPHLPAHDQATSDRCWSVLCTEDGHSGGLAAHANTEQQASDEELIPVLGASRADDR